MEYKRQESGWGAVGVVGLKGIKLPLGFLFNSVYD